MRQLWLLTFAFILAGSALGQSYDEELAPGQVGESEYQCEVINTDEPPFFISDAFLNNDRNWENMRAIEDKGGVHGVIGYVPRRSVVRVKPSYEYYNELLKPKDERRMIKAVPVEALYVPKDDIDKAASKSRNAIRDRVMGYRRRDRAKPGDKFALHSHSISHVKDYTFVVTHDSAMLEIPKLGEKIKDKGLRFDMTEDGEFFRVKRCCIQTAKGEECKNRYRFQVWSPDMKEIEEVISLSEEQMCLFETSARPVHNDQVQPLLQVVNMASKELGKGIEDLWVIDSLDPQDLKEIADTGVVRIPVNEETGEGPYGSYNYNSPDAGVRAVDDAYIHPMAACAFMKTLKEFQEVCPNRDDGCEVQFGDAYHPKEWGDHASHWKGNCIDMRVMKDRFSRRSVTYRHGWYDREKTQKLIDLLNKNGGSDIFFSDRRVKGVQHIGGHTKHIHVCFDPKSETVQKSCQ